MFKPDIQRAREIAENMDMPVSLRAYKLRELGLSWGEITTWLPMNHPIPGTKHYALRHGLPWPPEMPDGAQERIHLRAAAFRREGPEGAARYPSGARPVSDDEEEES